MPTYEYECEACGHGFERFQSITAAPIRKCPKCGKSKVKRLLGTGAGLIFKGKGFYITDYRSESYDKAAKAETGSASGNGEAKPAETKGTKSEGTKPAESKPAAAKADAKSESKPARSSSGKSKGK